MGQTGYALFKFTKGILQGKFISVFNYGKHARDFTYIDDAVRAILLVEKLKFIKKSFTGLSMLEMVSLLN